jgi:hypothetical protein
MTVPHLLWRWFLRPLLFIGVVLGTLLAIVLSVISWQGRREWAHVRAELLAKGEKLSQIELAPPPVPDAENVFADAIWNKAPDSGKSPIDEANTPLTPDEVARLLRVFPNYGRIALESSRASALSRLTATDPPARDPLSGRAEAEVILAALQPFDGLLARVHVLLERPYGRVPFEFGSPSAYYDSFSAFPPCMTISSAFSARAQAYLALGNSAAAARDLHDVIKLAEPLSPYPVLYCQLMRAGVLFKALPVIGLGLASHAWSDSELVEFQRMLDQVDLLAGIAFGFRGERGFHNELWEAFRKGTADDTWRRYAFQGDSKLCSTWMDLLGPLSLRAYLAIFAPGDQAAFNKAVQHIGETADAIPKRGWSTKPQPWRRASWRDWTFHYFTTRAMYLLAGNIDVTVMMQIEIRQTVVACALERYRLEFHAYPDTLAALVPRFLPKVPRDLLENRAYGYRLEAPDKFRLWSLGWNERDSSDDLIWNR